VLPSAAGSGFADTPAHPASPDTGAHSLREPARTPRLSIVVPAYQEGPLIASALRAIGTAARSCGLPFELIVVDDGSTDDTWATLEAARQEWPELVALRLSRNFGKEGAVAAGLDRATGDACIVLDADLQHPPSLIPEMVRLWRSGNWDVIDAVKSDRGAEPLPYRWTARAFYRVMRRLTGNDLQDRSDFKLLDRHVVEAWRRFGERVTFFRGMIAWLGFRRTQLFFDVPPRAAGRSHWSLSRLVLLATRAVTSFSALPLQVVTMLGIITLIVAAALGARALWLWYSGTAFPGFTTVILLQLMIGGFLMVSLGIIGTYIARIYDEVKARPRYVIREALGTHAGEREQVR
jgi:glycosyltransferase involved in cell wall biosynthesis